MVLHRLFSVVHVLISSLYIILELLRVGAVEVV